MFTIKPNSITTHEERKDNWKKLLSKSSYWPIMSYLTAGYMYNSLKISGKDLLLYVDIIDILPVDSLVCKEYR